MKVIQHRNMYEVFPRALSALMHEGLKGETYIECHTPMSLVLEHPTERLVYGNVDDMNPFAMLFNALWVMGGREDTSFMEKAFGGYHAGRSDDGTTLHGAYGHRIRSHFPAEPMFTNTIDQLKSAIVMLKKNDRRRDVVLSLWDAGDDLGLQSRNLPAATHIYLSIGTYMSLDMSVMYRDVDIYDMQVDSVAFSLMQEFIARALKIPVGRMTITMNHLNCYVSATEGLCVGQPLPNPYDHHILADLEVADSDAWLSELSMFLDEGPVIGMREPFFKGVVSHMWRAWGQYKETTGIDMSARTKAALVTVDRTRAPDWREASMQWITRSIHERTNLR